MRVVQIEPSVNEIRELTTLLKTESGYLDLAERFEKVFRDLPPVDMYQLILREKAGFTDSRIIFLWLKGQAMYNKSSFQIYHIEDTVELVNYSDFEEFVNRSEPSNELSYLKDPSIGLKK